LGSRVKKEEFEGVTVANLINQIQQNMQFAETITKAPFSL
jgi:hypothetical protein